MEAGGKSALYREVNLLTESLLGEFGSDEPAYFLCECPDLACSRRLQLRRVEFDAVRQAGASLVSLECVRDAPVLHRGETYAAVAAYCSSIEK